MSRCTFAISTLALLLVGCAVDPAKPWSQPPKNVPVDLSDSRVRVKPDRRPAIVKAEHPSDQASVQQAAFVDDDVDAGQPNDVPPAPVPPAPMPPNADPTNADPTNAAPQPPNDMPEPLPDGVNQPEPGNPLELQDVIGSVYLTFPLVEAAYLENDVAAGKQIAAWGAFDTKLKGASQSTPVGFYRTYRNSAGLMTPLYGGAEIFSGYRLGRGEFEPWYQERNTNDGGEFKAGVRIPLIRDRAIDERRAELWRATYDRQIAQPDIRGQLIMFTRDATVAYWSWIAAGKLYQISQAVLDLAKTRNDQLARRVDTGDLDPPVLQDNLRSIALREAKLLDRLRKLEQSAVKLSLYNRAPTGQPLVPTQDQLAGFPEPNELPNEMIEGDIQEALIRRPELEILDGLYQRVNVDLAEAQNAFLPGVDFQLTGSQDVGQATSSKRDKSPFVLEGALFLDVPVQRRKAIGKQQAARAKMRQIALKRAFTEDKVVVEIRAAATAIRVSIERVIKTKEARRLSEYIAEVERRKFELGQSDLLAVALREQYAMEAAEKEIMALLEYFAALADYHAAIALDQAP